MWCCLLAMLPLNYYNAIEHYHYYHYYHLFHNVAWQL
jgi:hypothetical protein